MSSFALCRMADDVRKARPTLHSAVWHVILYSDEKRREKKEKTSRRLRNQRLGFYILFDSVLIAKYNSTEIMTMFHLIFVANAFNKALMRSMSSKLDLVSLCFFLLLFFLFNDAYVARIMAFSLCVDVFRAGIIWIYWAFIIEWYERVQS